MTEPRVRPAAVLWDLDGTLVDTEPYWIEAEYDLIERHGGRWSREHALNLVGNDLLESGRYIREHSGIGLSPETIVSELLDRVVVSVGRQVPWMPGARELLGEIRGAGIRCGLVTMSYRRLVEPILRALPTDTFAVVVTGDEVSRGKPDPEAYQRAAALLELPPEHTLALEDSLTGATAASAAGCRVVVVPNHVEVPLAPGQVHLPGLAGVDLARLFDVVG